MCIRDRYLTWSYLFHYDQIGPADVWIFADYIYLAVQSSPRVLILWFLITNAPFSSYVFVIIRQTLDFWGFRVADPLSLCLINDYKGAKAIRKLDIFIWADTAGQIPTSILVYGQYEHVLYLVFNKAFLLSLLTFPIH